MGIVTVYLFLFVSKKKGFWYGAITFLVLILSAFLVNSIFECYFLHTIFNSSPLPTPPAVLPICSGNYSASLGYSGQ
jgi:hypothetical protein